MGNHTPTPWCVEGPPSDCGVYGPNGETVIECVSGSAKGWQFRPETDRANAVAIVAAVNSHAQLVAALRDYVMHVHHPFTTPFNFDEVVAHWESERAAGNEAAQYHLAALSALSLAEQPGEVKP